METSVPRKSQRYRREDEEVRVPWGELTLIAGLPRSGTTWLGEMVGQHPDVSYIFEPFTLRFHPDTPSKEIALALIRNHSVPRDDRVADSWVYDRATMESLSRYNNQIRTHLACLSEHYFPGEMIPHLVIKQPISTKIGWLVNALSPDRIVWISRHPAGVVNSYVRRNFMRTWSEPEFVFAKETVAATHPRFRRFFDYPQDAIERLTLITVIGEEIAKQQMVGQQVLPVSYEACCQETPARLREILSFCGLDRTAAEHFIFSALKSGARESHLKLNVDSLTKRDDWLRGLTPSQIRRIGRILDLLNAEWPLPGKGMSDQSLGDSLAAIAAGVRRSFWRLKRRIISTIPAPLRSTVRVFFGRLKSS